MKTILNLSASNQFASVDEVWGAVERGENVYWHNTAYKVFIERDNCPDLKMFGNRDGKCLTVRCIENHFGGKINPDDLKNLFTVGGLA